MRVITGTARGTNLKAPDGFSTRPTADKVKQAVFNIIQYEIAGDVLDLFAGSGQLLSTMIMSNCCNYDIFWSCQAKNVRVANNIFTVLMMVAHIDKVPNVM